MAAMVTGFITNIVLDYLFVWVLPWGMMGAAIAHGNRSGDDLFGMPCIFYRKEARPILSFRWRRALSFVPYLRRGTFPFRVDLFAQYHVDPAE